MTVVRVSTHAGIFHADEVFALAVLKIFLEKEGKTMEVVRTRDLAVIADTDMAVDVGGEYDASRNRFDHHQKGRAGTRENGIPYASLGLIWKHFGEKITSKKVVETIEQKLVLPIDALDNGVAISTPIYTGVREYTNFQILQAISLAYGDDRQGEAFDKAMEFACIVIAGEIKKSEMKIAGEEVVLAEIKKQKEPAYLVLEKYYPWEGPVSKCKNIKLVIFPDKFSSNWCLQVARDDLEVFGSDRINFPEKWRGLIDDSLADISGIPGSVFCHAGGFYAVVKSRSDAIEMAKKVVK